MLKGKSIKSKLGLLTGTAGAAMALAVGNAGSASATTIYLTDPLHLFYGTGTSRCLDVWQAQTTSGVVLDSWSCNGSSAQNWTGGPAGDGDPAHQILKNQNSNLCLDVVNGGTAAGTKVDQWRCNGTPAQDWEQVPASTPSGYEFWNPQSGKCLDVSGGSTTAGTAMDIWYCNNTAAQAVWFGY